MVLNWGIVGAGNISSQFVKAISILPNTEHQVIAIASQDLSRAEDFAVNNNVAKAYGDYKSLAQATDIDIVYIGNLNTQHYDVSRLMLNNGKHVLCEKPLTLNEKQTCALIELAQKKSLFLMEAIWSRCFPIYEELRKQLDANTIGEVLYVEASFGKKLDHVERLNSREMGGGTILDLGVYLLQLQQFVFKGLQPINVVASGHLNSCGTDESSSTIICYPNGKTAVLSTHARIQLTNEAIIVGTDGILRVRFSIIRPR